MKENGIKKDFWLNTFMIDVSALKVIFDSALEADKDWQKRFLKEEFERRMKALIDQYMELLKI